MKITSAEKIRLTTVRGVSAGAGALYNGDGGQADIGPDDIVQSYHQEYPDFWSTANEIEYRTTVVPQASAAVKNIGGTSEGLADGHANLSHVTVTDSLTAEDFTANGDVKLGSTVSVVSGGEWVQGLTQDFDIGGTILRFIDGILVDSWDNS